MGDRSKVAFARQHKLPGGASMLSQHLHGHRPIGLEAAVVYARGLGVTLGAFSPRLERLVASAVPYLSQDGNTAQVVRDAINFLERQPLVTLRLATLLSERLDRTSALLVEAQKEVHAGKADQSLLGRLMSSLMAATS